MIQHILENKNKDGGDRKREREQEGDDGELGALPPEAGSFRWGN